MVGTAESGTWRTGFAAGDIIAALVQTGKPNSSDGQSVAAIQCRQASEESHVQNRLRRESHTDLSAAQDGAFLPECGKTRPRPAKR